MQNEETKPKKPFLKNKYIIIIFLVGFIVTRLGALYKLNSHPIGGMLLTIGLLLQIIACILGVIKLLTIKEVRNFLNS